MPLPRFLSIVFLAGFTLPALAQGAAPVIPTEPPSAGAAADTRPVTRSELPGLVREALMNEPEMLKDAIQKLREKQEAEAKKKTEEAMAKRKDELFNDPALPSMGAGKDADVTFVEFFDYHCGYCRHMVPAITKLAGEDKKVRFVFIEYPILSEDSVSAARAALAVNRIARDKYFAYHTELMKHQGKYEEKALLDIGTKLGIDSGKLKAEMAKPEITAALDKNREIGADLGVSGTPALIVGNTLVPGAVPYEELKKMTANIRAGKPAIEEKPAIKN